MISKMFTCQICSNFFSDKRVPYVLNCGHTLCLKCIDQLTSQKCPFCLVRIKEKIVNYYVQDNIILNDDIDFKNFPKMLEKLNTFFSKPFGKKYNNFTINVPELDVDITKCNIVCYLLQFTNFNGFTKSLIEDNWKNSNSNEISLITLASILGNTEILQFLLTKEKLIDQDAICYASRLSRKNGLDPIMCLLDNGANINYQDDDLNTPLMYAALNSNSTSNLDTVKLLIEKGADINLKCAEGSPVLIEVTRNIKTTSSFETFKYLVDNGADVNVQNDQGFTPLIMAVANSHKDSSLEAVNYLIEKGAQLELKDEDGCTPLMHAAYFSNDGSSVETVKLLVEKGCDINSCSNDGTSILSSVASNTQTSSNIDTLDFLLKNGANINYQDEDGWTALMHCAYSNNDVNAIKKIVNFGANIKLFEYTTGKNALNLAVDILLTKGNNNETVKYLSNIYADKNLYAEQATQDELEPTKSSGCPSSTS